MATKKTTRKPRPPAAAGAAAGVAAAVVGGIFNAILGRKIPDYATQANLDPSIVAAAGLRNGMTPDEVNAAIHAVHPKA